MTSNANALADAVVPTPPLAIPQDKLNPQFEYAGFLDRLLTLKGQGYAWLRTYEVPGRKMLRKIVGEAYAVFCSIEQSDNSHDIYQRLGARLRSEKVRMHGDAPNSAILVRTVFPSLDPSRVSKYARALDAAGAATVKPGGFEAFIADAGGFEKVRLPLVTVLVPGSPAKPAKPDTFKEVAPLISDDIDDELADDELEDLEFGDELHELLSQRKAEPFLAVPNLSPEQQARIDQTVPERVVLIAEICGAELRIFDQMPYVEEAVIRAYRTRYPTCQDLREAQA